MPTLIIGMYYQKGEGAVIISDSRLQMGTDYYTVQKIFEIHPEIVFASSGYAGIQDELFQTFQSGMAKTRMADLEQLTTLDIARFIGQVQNEIYYRYKMCDRPYFRQDDTLLDAILGYIHEDSPKLYLLYENGFLESIRYPPFRAIGDGSRHANSILKRLYSPRLSKERAIEIGVHAIIQTSKIDAVVDDNPQIATIESNGCELWNIGENGDFDASTEEISKIKRKINGVGERQDALFNLLLDGSEDIIKRFNDLFAEYEKA